ncbi:MAG: hypothetical protein ACOC5B_01505 [Myxococcota bacterium]
MRTVVMYAVVAPLALSLWTSSTMAQEEQTSEDRTSVGSPAHVFTVDPGALIDGRLSFELDNALSDFLSFHVGASFLFFDGVFDDSDESFFGIGPRLGLRLFLVGDAPAGLWLGPFADLYYLRWEDRQGSDHHFGYAVGAEAGVTFVLLRVLALQLGVAFSYHDLVVRDGIDPRFRLGVGIAF